MIEIPDKEFERLRGSEERYKTLIKTSPDAVTVTDLEGRITEVSKQAIEIHGCKDEKELIGKNALELIAPEDHEKAIMNIQKTLKEGSVKNIEYTLLRKDGSRYIGELNASLIKDPSGKPKAFIATTRDITERKEAEKALRESEANYRMLAENAEDFIFIVDCVGKILYVNSFAARQLSQPPEKVVGKTLDELFPSNISERHKWNIQRVCDLCQAMTFEGGTSFVGREAWLSTRLVPLMSEDGKAQSVLGISRDVTRYKRIEDELRQKMKELKEFNDLAVSRELKMIELEKELGRLQRQISKKSAPGRTPAGRQAQPID